MQTDGYHPQFDFEVDLAYGKAAEAEAQAFVDDLRGAAVEVKADRYRNGKMVVETQQRPAGKDWQHSGINVTTARWWAYRLAPGSFLLVEVERLAFAQGALNGSLAGRHTLPLLPDGGRAGPGTADFSGNRYTGVARHTASLGADLATRPGIYLHATWLWTDRLPLNDANTDWNDAWNVLNLKAGWRRNLLRERFTLDISGGLDNALNQRYSPLFAINANGATSAMRPYFQPAPDHT